MTVAAQLVEWAWSGSPAAAPASAHAAATRHLLDGLGCALAAARTGAAASAVAVATGLGGPDEATIIGGRRVGAPAAALANGALVHALDFDDTHADALVHATAAVLPAALAAAEEAGATGRALLDACIVGYEAVTRLGTVVRHGFHARGFHATSVCGVFAAALVTARLHGRPPGEAVNALGIAGSMAAGSLEFLADGSATKQLHPGLAAHAGMLAARLAAAGATGPATIFEGPAGLYRAYADQEVDPGAVLDGLGERWECERITIKPYPACQLSHAALDALAAVREEVEADAVARLDVDVPDDSVPVVCEPAAAKAAPRTPYEAKFSLPWCLAVLLLDGRLDLASFAAERLGRPDARDLAARVHVHPFDPGTAAAQAPGRVVVHLRGGRTVVGAVPVSSGGPDRPLPEARLLEKLTVNAGEAALARDLERLVLDLHGAPDVRPLTALLAAQEEVALP